MGNLFPPPRCAEEKFFDRFFLGLAFSGLPPACEGAGEEEVFLKTRVIDVRT
ncbi:MAG: hypothetical protein LRY46_02975 [Candidatus Pacebacteria bacterium]|nr:hypothetical protein [Candidatus Paceibacterota bacterium]